MQRTPTSRKSGSNAPHRPFKFLETLCRPGEVGEKLLALLLLLALLDVIVRASFGAELLRPPEDADRLANQAKGLFAVQASFHARLLFWQLASSSSAAQILE